jgi:hypothetical protein
MGVAAAPAAVAAEPTRPTGRQRLLFLVLALAGAVAVAGALLSVNRLDPSLRRLTVPGQVADFRLQRELSSAEIDALAAGGSFAGFAGEELRSARIGLYAEGRGSSPTLILVGLSARADPDVRARLAGSDPVDLIADVFASFGSAPTRQVEPGKLGGAVACGSVRVGGAAGSLGVWADHSTVGVVELMEPRGLDSTALLTRRFRGASEH